MKRFFRTILLIPVILGLTACSRNDASDSDHAPQSPDTTAYTFPETSAILVDGSSADKLKTALAEKIPELKRPADTVLLQTTVCSITIGQLMNNLAVSLGTRASQLAGVDPDQIRKNLSLHSERMAVQKILLERALQAGYRGTAVQVDSALHALSQRYGGLDAYKTLLSQYGISFDFVRGDTEKTVIINNYLRSVLAGASASAAQHSERVAAYIEDLKDETQFTFVGW